MKKVLVGIVELYDLYFRSVFNTGIILVAILFFADMFLLAFNETSLIHPYSLVRFLFLKSNMDKNYAIIDLSKTIYLFLLSWFAVSFFRYLNTEPKEEWKSSFLLKNIKADEAFLLIVTLVICSCFDWLCFTAIRYNIVNAINESFNLWIYSFLYYVRAYLPMVLFSIVITKLLSGKWRKQFAAHWFLLIISIWAFSQLSYETTYAIELLAIKPFATSSSRDDMQLIISSLVEIPMLSCLTIGYAACMSLPLMDKAKEEPTSPAN